MRPVEDRQRRVLGVVLGINAVMFVIELGAAMVARSTALLADSADMLGDVIVYAFSLYVVGRGLLWQSRAALLKGCVMALFGVAVLVEVTTKIAYGINPDGGVMSAVGLLALAANGSVLAALWQHRTQDLNMRSVWLCSRNDVIANVGVLAGALGVVLTGTAWPDVIVGLAIAALFIVSAIDVLRAGLSAVAASRSH